ncbi:MAG: SDR family NAD(P)-dependent oxidoreductase [Gammaproteobacteria bacterium]|nr:SDR family NAD(P)-dependent oxidoreductase [Gammaproteobacteria bacterium]
MSVNRRRFLGLAGASLATGTISGCGVDKLPDGDVPQSAFDAESTAEEVTAGIDLKGKLAVVTGCTSGIGFETMRVLALRGAYVVGTSRSLSRAQEACKRVTGVTTPVQMDLADLDSVVRCAEDVLSLKTPVDFLICNAGYRGGGNDREIVNGVEKHFAINHLGHFVFVNRLLGRMFLAWQARIVLVASRTAYTDAPDSGILFDDLRFTSDYDDSMAYAHSKLANVLFSLRLSQLLRGTRITTNALHPGVINTDIDRNLNAVTRFGFGLLTALNGKTVEQGAATSCYVATAEALGATSGAYFEDCNATIVGGHNHLRNIGMAERLVEVSEALTADYLVEQQRPDWEKLKQ